MIKIYQRTCLEGMTLLLFVFFYSATPLYSQDARLLRFPAIHANQVVFVYAGDLYTVSSSGGTARKITNNVGYESFPRFSPDGKTIAFTFMGIICRFYHKFTCYSLA